MQVVASKVASKFIDQSSLYSFAIFHKHLFVTVLIQAPKLKLPSITYSDPIDVSDHESDTDEEDFASTAPSVKGKWSIYCSICGDGMLHKSLQRHAERIHDLPADIDANYTCSKVRMRAELGSCSTELH